MRKDLSVGNYIFLNREGFKVKPLAKEREIKNHIQYLKNKIENSSPDVNVDLMKDRIKNLKNKSLDVYIPEELRRKVSFNRDMDYLLRMTASSRAGYYKLFLKNREVMIPKFLFDKILNKVNNLQNTMYSIGKVITIQEE